MFRIILCLLLCVSSLAEASQKWVGPFTLMAAGSMSGNLTSDVVKVQTMDNIGVEFVWTGTPTGTINIDISNDQVTWQQITLSPGITPAGGASNAYLEYNQISAPYFRCRYTRTGGTGTLFISVTEKGI
jgi:hypothetical protein